MELKREYKDQPSQTDLKEEIRSRRQKPKESLEAFYESIMMMVDRFPVPFSDDELLEILTRNVLREVKKDFLYVSVHFTAHLRSLCAKRERFLADIQRCRDTKTK